MSTADGLVVSTAQIFANDIFRRSLAPKFMAGRSDTDIDRIGLLIGRVATILVLLASIWLAWSTRDKNIALLVWIGVGGMMAATAAPMFLGVLWRRATRAGAIAGFLVGGIVFSALHSGSVKASWFSGSALADVAVWLEAQAVNPYACATLGAALSITAMVIVSYLSTPPSDEHLDRIFPQ